MKLGQLPRAVRLVYPEKRTVTEYVIDSWFYDAVANEDISASDAKKATTLKARCLLLADVGIITLHRDWEVGCE